MRLLKAAIGMMLEGIINPVLRLDPELKYLLEPLIDQRLAVVIHTSPKSHPKTATSSPNCHPRASEARAGDLLRLVFCAEEGRLRISANDYADADVELSGTLVDLLRLAFSENPQPILAQKSVSLVGNTNVLQGYQKLMQQLDLDWEGHLSAIIGPIAAHEIGELARKAKSFHKSSSQETCQDITEYLQEEARLIPPREEVEDFYQDIAQLQQDVERFEAKFKA